MRISPPAPGEVSVAEHSASRSTVRVEHHPRLGGIRVGVHGIVLAGVYPDARSPLDRLLPRPLLPVVQQPLITHVLRWLGGNGVLRATICTNPGSRAVQAGLEAMPLAMQLGYVEDPTPRGPAGCVRDAGLAADADTFIVADATSIPLADIGALLATHRAEGAAVTVGVTPDPLGRLRPCDLYVFGRRAFASIPADGFQDIKERLLPALHARGERVALHVTRGTAPRAVNTRSYVALDQWALEQAVTRTEMPAGFRLQGQAIVHESASVAPGARVLGPVIIGPEAIIEAGATIVGPTDIGASTTIRAGAMVSRAVIWRGSTIGPDAFVDRCMLPEGSVVGVRETAIGMLR